MTRRCDYWSSGWCYKPDSSYENGCVGSDDCKYIWLSEAEKFVNKLSTEEFEEFIIDCTELRRQRDD